MIDMGHAVKIEKIMKSYIYNLRAFIVISLTVLACFSACGQSSLPVNQTNVINTDFSYEDWKKSQSETWEKEGKSFVDRFGDLFTNQAKLAVEKPLNEKAFLYNYNLMRELLGKSAVASLGDADLGWSKKIYRAWDATYLIEHREAMGREFNFKLPTMWQKQAVRGSNPQPALYCDVGQPLGH